MAWKMFSTPSYIIVVGFVSFVLLQQLVGHAVDHVDAELAAFIRSEVERARPERDSQEGTAATTVTPYWFGAREAARVIEKHCR